MREFSINLDQVERISAVRIFMPQDLTSSSGRKKVELSVKELMKRFPDDSVPLLDPVKDMGITDSALQTLMKRALALSERLSEHKLSTDFEEERRISLVNAYENKSDLQEQARVLREEARSCQTIVLKEDLKKMKKVLKRLGHVDANGVIQTKGRRLPLRLPLVIVFVERAGILQGQNGYLAWIALHLLSIPYPRVILLASFLLWTFVTMGHVCIHHVIPFIVIFSPEGSLL